MQRLNVHVGNVCPDVKSWGEVGMEEVGGRWVGRQFPPLSAAFALYGSNLTSLEDGSSSPAPHTRPALSSLLRTVKPLASWTETASFLICNLPGSSVSEAVVVH